MTFKTFVQPDFDSNDIHQTFYPFSRFREDWNFYEVIKTIFLAFAILPIRIISLFITIISCYTICLFLIAMNHSSLTSPLKFWEIYLYKFIRNLGVVILWIFGIYKINYKYLTYKEMRDLYGYKNAEIRNDQKCCTIVSNHINFTDIPMLLFIFSASFVAKQGVSTTPFFGIIARCIQTLFLKKLKISHTCYPKISAHEASEK